MRVINYILFIFLLLLAGSSKSYSNNSLNHKYRISSDKFSKSRSTKYNNKSNNTIIFLDTDIEIEEECDQTHDFKKSNLKKIDYEKYLFSNQLESLLITSLSLDHFLNYNKNFARCCGHTNPIYITLQVFRI